MVRYTLTRLGLGIVTLFCVIVVVFVASRFAGDVVYLLVSDDASPEEIEAVRQEMGLHRPYHVQFGYYLGDLLAGDFGESIHYRRPALGLVLARLPATLELTFASFAVSMALGVSLGIAAALRRGGWIDGAIRSVGVLGQATPNFWIGVMAILVFAVTLGWLPTGGRQGAASLILPVATLATFSAAAVMRITRSAMLETLDSEYIRFLRVKGTSEARVIWQHALRNSLVPVVSLAGVQLAGLLSGTVIVETVFNWPGLGTLMIEAVRHNDYPVIQTGVLITASLLILLNLLIDLSFGLIDPRVRYD